jgi:hypothetical protein
MIAMQETSWADVAMLVVICATVLIFWLMVFWFGRDN